MSFDPWNGRTTIRFGGQPLGDQPLGDALIITESSRPSAPPAPIYTTISSPRKAEPGRLHWVVQWKPRGAAPAAGWTVSYTPAPPAPIAPPAQPTQLTHPAQPPAAQTRPTLGGSARSISRHLTATWDATGTGKPTTIAT